MNRHFVYMTVYMFSAIMSFTHAAHGDHMTLRSSRVDGLPLHLMAVTAKGVRTQAVIDLVPAFRKLAVYIPPNGSVVYDTRNGMLFRNLPPESHDMLEHALELIYAFENMRDVSRAYCDLLKPLSEKERIEVALRTGFPPDPLIASVIDKIRLYRSVIPSDPFDDEEGTRALPVSEEKLKAYESVLKDLLSEKIKELEKQLNMVELLETADTSSKTPPKKG